MTKYTEVIDGTLRSWVTHPCPFGEKLFEDTVVEWREAGRTLVVH